MRKFIIEISDDFLPDSSIEEVAEELVEILQDAEIPASVTPAE